MNKSILKGFPLLVMLSIIENKKLVAQSEITLSIGKDDVVTGTIQHEIVDESTATTLKEGDESDLVITAEQGKKIVDALSPILTEIVNATTPASTDTKVVPADDSAATGSDASAKPGNNLP